ncbi:hypothetical protein CspeluHIS016_0114810 [Cutaneotrichosporon spelunceum]|uniref:Uncharacterized protein n=1 Tax=Cutaneotrichosporon spelunceum TaxID=1672016 RepID=A0AAD3TR68_9TREE|nr:hypothetical protein CspeluHIS016_0114810 [Cutaneotrichosporon spelunceum]
MSTLPGWLRRRGAIRRHSPPERSCPSPSKSAFPSREVLDADEIATARDVEMRTAAWVAGQGRMRARDLSPIQAVDNSAASSLCESAPSDKAVLFCDSASSDEVPPLCDSASSDEAYPLCDSVPSNQSSPLTTGPVLILVSSLQTDPETACAYLGPSEFIINDEREVWIPGVGWGNPRDRATYFGYIKPADCNLAQSTPHEERKERTAENTTAPSTSAKKTTSRTGGISGPTVPGLRPVNPPHQQHTHLNGPGCYFPVRTPTPSAAVNGGRGAYPHLSYKSPPINSSPSYYSIPSRAHGHGTWSTSHKNLNTLPVGLCDGA